MKAIMQTGLIMLSNSSVQTQGEGIQSSSDRLPTVFFSEDGAAYRVGYIRTDVNYVGWLYQQMQGIKETFHPVGLGENIQSFTQQIFKRENVFLSVDDDLGFVYLTDIIPGFSAKFNFIFWDRKIKGRNKLILQILKWFSEEFLVQRFEIRVHALAFNTLHRYYKLGAFYEGTKRKAWKYEDKMIDLHILSILADEVKDEDNLALGNILRTRDEKRWYGKLATRNGDKNGGS